MCVFARAMSEIVLINLIIDPFSNIVSHTGTSGDSKSVNKPEIRSSLLTMPRWYDALHEILRLLMTGMTPRFKNKTSRSRKPT